MMERMKYEVLMESNQDIDVMKLKIWLEENIGPQRNTTTNESGKWDVRWQGFMNLKGGLAGSSYTWFFENEKDAALFALRWL